MIGSRVESESTTQLTHRQTETLYRVKRRMNLRLQVKTKINLENQTDTDFKVQSHKHKSRE